MKILYVGYHDYGCNDEEGAIAHALADLGHEVIRLHERDGRRACEVQADLCLCHKWLDLEAMRAVRVPKVCWYFDLVSFPERSLARRNAERAAWALQVEDVADLLFMTDGDWVAARNSPKVRWLPQGADGRVAGAGWTKEQDIPVLFTGTANGGTGRESFVAEMREKYGPAFYHVTKGAHGRTLADLIARSKIVVAPDAPVTDRYWSNRVYLTLGFGGFLLHPFSEGLAAQYTPEGHLDMYRSRDQLHRMIDYYLPRPEDRAAIASDGLRHTLNAHTYRHRVEQMMAVVKERLGL